MSEREGIDGGEGKEGGECKHSIALRKITVISQTPFYAS